MKPREMRLLVVDDDDTVRRMLVRALRRSHADVVDAACVDDALEQLRSQAFDVVVTDYELPDGNGRTILAFVREHLPNCIRVLMSGAKAPPLKDPPCEHFFAKPEDLTELLTFLRSQPTRRHK